MGPKPITEIELTDLQERWLNDKDQVAYQKMFELLVQYSRSIILKMTRGKKFLNPDYVFNVAVDATIKFFEQYEKNPQFKIDYSFAGILRYKVLECLYGPKIQKQDAIGSINSYVKNADDIEELENLQDKFDMKPYWTSQLDYDDPMYKIYHTEETAVHTIMSVIHDLYDTSLSQRDILILLIAFLHSFRKTKNFDAFSEMYLNKDYLKDIYEQSMLEIRDRLSEEV